MRFFFELQRDDGFVNGFGTLYADFDLAANSAKNRLDGRLDLSLHRSSCFDNGLP